MKVIELISKLINGEEAPNKIEYDGVIWHLCINRKDYYSDEALINNYLANCELSIFINDEIEIIEEEKKIEKLMQLDTRETQDCICKIQYKVNEIIDKLNKLKEGKK
jgi:hypothetical protein